MERTIRIVRHAAHDYPRDSLTEKGVSDANGMRVEVQEFNRTVSSPKNRAMQTAVALGKTPEVDPRLDELEDPDIYMPTAEEYVHELYRIRLEKLLEYAKRVREVMFEQEEDALLVSHGAVMSACLYILTGKEEIVTFGHLEGFTLNRSDTVNQTEPRIKINKR